MPPKLLACIGFLYKVVHKNGRLRKFNRSREIGFNFLRCPETLFISHEEANFLFSVFRVVQGEAKNTKNNGVLQGKFCIFTFPKDWHFSWKMNIRMSDQTVTFRSPSSFVLVTSKLAFSLHASQRCLAGTTKNVWVRAQNSAKINFLPPRLKTYLAWTFLFLRSFLNNYPWTFEKNSFFKKLWV